MATIYDSRGTSALNEKDYINKLYDTSLGSQKDAIDEGYKNSIMQLNASQKNTQGQTQEYLKRAYVEGGRAYGNMKASTGVGGTTVSGMGAGANAQARLTLGNQNQANTTALNQQQAEADMEYNRQRQLKSDWYAAQIKKAQADNDMNRAQALYDAAKAEEEQLRSLRQSGALLMAGKGDNSILDAIGKGEAVTIDETTPTWDGVLKNEEAINKIYDAQLEGQRVQAQAEMDKSLSDLDAAQQASRREMDKSLTATYVDALKKGKNYQEVQTAYGQGSGTAAQARLARESELIKKLTDIRALQIGKDTQTEGKRLGATETYADALLKAVANTNQTRNQELYKAAEQEEQNIVSDQQLVGDQYAKNGDYSMLARLYGLTPQQLAMLTPNSAGISGGSGWSARGGGDVYQQIKDAIKQGKPYADVLKAIMTNTESLTSQQVNELKNANTENGYKEVQRATVTNSSGGNAENSAYWSSQKTKPYTNPGTVNTTAKKTAAASTDKGAHTNSAYWSTKR